MEIINISCYNALANKNCGVNMKTCKNTFILVLVLALLIVCLFACDKSQPIPSVDYQTANTYNVNVIDDSYALTYEPILNPTYVDGKLTGYTSVKYTYGLIFYVGTAISPECYSYLASALAKQGYLVVIPKYNLNMVYYYYSATEKAFSLYPDVKFFIGGHSQGGGAAIRRASENASIVQGAILYAPLAYRHPLLDENGNNVQTEEGVDIYINDNLKDANLATLLIEASNDHVLNDSAKEDAKSRLADGYTHKVITPSAHMSFSTMDSDEVLAMFNNDGDGITQNGKDTQRAKTIEYTLDFLRSVVTK